MTSYPSASLLGLPFEIREQIYQDLFRDTWLTFETHPGAYSIFTKHQPFWFLLPPEASILVTCKQIYAEASSLCHATVLDKLRFKGPDAIKFMNMYSKASRRAKIKHVRGVYSVGNYRYTKYLSKYPNLQTVHITYNHASYFSNGAAALKTATYDELLLQLNQSGMDLSYNGIPDLQRRKNWTSLRIDTNIIFAPGPPGPGPRNFVPCSFDCIAKTVTKHWEKEAEPTKGGVYPTLFDPPSALADRERAEYSTPDQDILRQRYARHLGHQVTNRPIFKYEPPQTRGGKR